MKLRSFAIALAAAALAPAALAQQADHPGKAVYDQACALCHNDPANTPGAERAAPLSVLRNTSPADLQSSLTGDGIMAPMAAALSEQQLTELVGWLTAEQKAADVPWDEAMLCAADNRTVDISAPVAFGGFGGDEHSTRSISYADAGLTRAGMSNLAVDWALGFPRAQNLGVGTPSIGDTLFVNGGGKLLAVDANEGCARWVYDGGGSRTTPQIARINNKTAILYVTGSATVHVVDAQSGELVWKADGKPDNGVGAVRGGVVVHQDKVIVPISASGVASGMNPKFECCTGHGAVVALSAADGSKLWEYHTMKEAEYNGFVNDQGVKQRGPSGAPIWAMPTIDAKRNRVLVATGENTSHPATVTSDAIIAIDLDTGEQDWVFQAMESDVWNMACESATPPADSLAVAPRPGDGPNCPMHFGGNGRDYDFGAQPILARTKGGLFGLGAKDIILAGQKSGDVWALDAETGEVLWNERVGYGSALGGVHWGIATDGKNVFIPINDPAALFAAPLEPKAGMYAFDIKTGKPVWSYEASASCDPARSDHITQCENFYGFSAAPVIVGDTLVAGTLDGWLYVFDAKNGRVLQKFDAARTFETTNGVEARGGSIEAHGISVGAGHILVGAGYGSFGQTPGNAFIALKPAE